MCLVVCELVLLVLTFCSGLLLGDIRFAHVRAQVWNGHLLLTRTQH